MRTDVTGAQRLRLVLALGVVNLVLATVALGVGITGTQQPQIAVVEPTAPPTIVTPGAGSSSGRARRQPGRRPAARRRVVLAPRASPLASRPPVVRRSRHPQSRRPRSPHRLRPTIEPSAQPSAAPSSGPVLAGGPEPDPASPPPVRTTARAKPPPPKPTPTPTTPTPVTDGRSPCHASDQGFVSSDGKACVHKHDNKGKADKPAHHDNGRHSGQQAGHGGRHGQHQPATVESPRRSHASRHRLRTGRRAR